MGSANYYEDGGYNFYCDLCGKKAKSSSAVKTWDGFYVCRSHKEVRNPQDFLRGVKEDQKTPWARPEATDTFVPSWATPILDTGGNPILGNDLTPILDIGQ